ncbi:MAG: hypothetical protein SPH01_08835 [Prevotella sp.]|nr:hypothetical protein [Prevotella sp.]
MKNLTWQNPEQLFVAQELINKVKSKCCGIKDIYLIARFITLILSMFLLFVYVLFAIGRKQVWHLTDVLDFIYPRPLLSR